MKRKQQILTAVVLSGSMGLGAQTIFAQTTPGSSPGATTPGQTGPTVPQPEPSFPRQPQPTIPGQPAPGLPQTAPIPGQPTPGPQTGPVPGQQTPGLPQTSPLPGQPGTIPERVENPDAGKQGMAGTSADNIRKAQEALRAKGLNPGSVSGTMDAKTQQALRDFQKANNLPVTGVLDQRTAQQLGVTLDGEPRVPQQQGPGNTMPGSGSSNR